MLNFIKVLSTEINSLSERIVKFLRYGRSDVKTAKQVTPFGIDSQARDGMVAVYVQTGSKSGDAVIGYINKNQLVGSGEFRCFSETSNGDLATYHYLKSDGTQEIGGNTDFMVRYTALETAFNQLKADFDNHVHAGVIVSVSGGGGAPAVGVSGESGAPTEGSSADITPAKILQIKTL